MKTFLYKDMRVLTIVLRCALGVYTALAAMLLVSHWVHIDLVQRAASGAAGSDAALEGSNLRQILLSFLHTLCFVSTAVVYCVWIHRASRNAHALRAEDMNVTPGWAIAWYFIPIASLWMPYITLKEIFKASHPEHLEIWHRAPRPLLLPLWWALFISRVVILYLIIFLEPNVETIEQSMTITRMAFVSDTLALLLGIVVIALVAKLQAAQSEKHRRLVSAAAEGLVPVAAG